MTREPIPNHPKYWRSFIGVHGPREDKWKAIITWDFGKWSWRYKRPDEMQFVYVGPVDKVKNLVEEIRMIELVADIY
jgi:hypothetical protein